MGIEESRLSERKSSLKKTDVKAPGCLNWSEALEQLGMSRSSDPLEDEAVEVVEDYPNSFDQ